jgi:hypothetical protein
MKLLKKKDVKLIVLRDYLAIRKAELCFLEELKEIRDEGQDVLALMNKFRVNNVNDTLLLSPSQRISGDIYSSMERTNKVIRQGNAIARNSGYDDSSLDVDYNLANEMQEHANTFPLAIIENIKQRISIVEAMIEELEDKKK